MLEKEPPACFDPTVSGREMRARYHPVVQHLASHWVKEYKLESVIVVWVSFFVLKVTSGKLVEQCIYTVAVFINEGPTSTYLYPLEHNGKSR